MEIRTAGNREVSGTKTSPAKAKTKVPARKKTGRKPGGRPPVKIRVAAARIVVLAGIGVLLTTFALLIVILAFSSETFDLRDVRCTGCLRQDEKKLEQIIRAEFPANILRIDLDLVQQRVEQELWVQRVELHRVLPSALLLHVTERTPTAIVELGGRQMAADSTGTLLGVYDGGFGKLNSPIFKGFMGDDPETYSMYGEENAGRIKRGLAMITEVSAEMPGAAHKISEVDLSDRNNLKILMDGDTVEIYLGREDYLKRIRSLVNDPENRYQELKNQGFEVEQIDLRQKGEIIYRYRRKPSGRQEHRT
ncbi:MAG: FtsQ-type POTRA domain-containing protein [Acidobacteriota bacterium]|jgi:cell division septal protein FtsQ|nr:FtsQ-type POTRA domain-containing protein [Acidobacteriota bacterium]